MNRQKVNEIKKGDIYIVNVPYEDVNQSKCRPVVIVSTEEHNKNAYIVYYVPLTSNLKRAGQYNNVKVRCCGLKKESVAKCDRIECVDKKELKEKIGFIYGKELERINRAIRQKILLAHRAPTGNENEGRC